MEKYFVTFLIVVSLLLSSCAQQKAYWTAKIDYWTTPYWAKALDKPNANYYKACKKFDKYWAKHFPSNLTEEEYEYKTEGQKTEQEIESSIKDPRPFYMKLFQSKERAIEKSSQLHVKRKRFEKWRLECQPYIKEDGHIMTPEERVAVWNQFQKM